MWSLVSEIESYIKALLRESPRGWIQIRRKDLAENFECVPSQITYVVNTRFTTQHGYYVESRRGGSGFISICRLGALRLKEAEEGGRQVRKRSRAGDSLEGMMENFQEVLFSLAQRGILTDREFTLLCTVFRTLEANISGNECDDLRFRILKEILSSGDYWGEDER
jgi:transcriptional regulator CtsR